MPRFTILTALLFVISCADQPKEETITLDPPTATVPSSLDVQGHRGCRGEWPENTLVAFEKAADIGVTTLEMDLVVAADGEVIVSHEPFFSHEIALDSLGNEIRTDQEKEHNLYRMNIEEIQRYDVGLRPHHRFPNQKKIAAVKPRFLDVVRSIESRPGKRFYYNVEIKRKPEWDSLYHPPLREFVTAVLDAIASTGIEDRMLIQSFDIASLQVVHEMNPELSTVLLMENEVDVSKEIEKLGFTPTVYSPYYIHVTPSMVDYCKANNLQLIPWTVNETIDLLEMIDLGVDGIITDYPTRLLQICDSLDLTVR